MTEEPLLFEEFQLLCFDFDAVSQPHPSCETTVFPVNYALVHAHVVRVLY